MSFKVNKLGVNKSISDTYNVDVSGHLNIDGSIYLWGAPLIDTCISSGTFNTTSGNLILYKNDSDTISISMDGRYLTSVGIDNLYNVAGTAGSGTFLRGDWSWGALPAGVTDWISLNDTPGSYTGYSGYSIKVNSTEDGLEFVQTEQLSVNISDINATGTPNSTSYLRGDGTWATVEGGGGGAPGGDDGALQFNDNGAFNGSELLFNKSVFSFEKGDVVSDAGFDFNFMSDKDAIFKLTTYRSKSVIDVYTVDFEDTNYIEFWDRLATDGVTEADTSLGILGVIDLNSHRNGVVYKNSIRLAPNANSGILIGGHLAMNI